MLKNMLNYRYKVVINTNLNNFDKKILMLFYQPIIGYKATAFFCNLWNYAEHFQSFNFEDATWDNYQRWWGETIDESTIKDMKKKLETFGLLKTYWNFEKSLIIWEMYSPLTPAAFFKNKILNQFLLNKLENYQYEKLKYSFIQNIDLINKSRDITTIDYSELICPELVTSEEQDWLTIDRITINIEEKQTTLNNELLTNHPERFEPNLSLLNELPPTKYLFNITARLISEQEKDTIANLEKTFQYSSNIINCLLHFSVFKNRGAINVNYIFKIAETLKNLNITDLQEIIEHLKNAHYRSQNKPITYQQNTLVSKKSTTLKTVNVVDAEEELLIDAKMQKIIQDYGLKTSTK